LSILRANANKLKSEDPELYGALFNYSLIVDRGGLSKGSLSVVLSSEDFDNFNDFMKSGDVESKLKGVFTSMTPEARQLLTPSLIEAVSSDAAFNRKMNASDVDPEEINEAQVNKNRKNHRHTYGWLSTLRNDKAKANAKDPEKPLLSNILRIKETGTIVAWNDTLKVYLPVSKAMPDISIPISIEGLQSNNQVFDVNQFGFDYGWEIKVQTDLKGGKTGRIIRKTSGKQGWYDVLIDGRIRSMRKSEIKELNPGIILDRDLISLNRMGKILEDRTVYYNRVAGKMSLHSKQGSYVPVELTSDLEYMYDSSDKAIYNPEFARFVELNVGKIDQNFVVENLMNSTVVKNFRRALVSSAYRSSNPLDKILSNEEVDKVTNKESLRAQSVRDKFDNLHPIEVISLIRRGKKGWESFIRDIISDSNYSWGVTDAEFNPNKIPTKITRAELSYITDPELAPTISISQVLEILDGTDIDEKVYFDKVISTLGTDKVAYVTTSGEIMNGERFLPDEVINPRLQESKDYDVPESLREQANTVVGSKTLKRIAKIFNQ
jgi:hypothetical protein